MNLQELSAHVAREFEKAYGRPPRWIAAAPGRVNVIGEHIDYNDGFVLPMAIEYYTVMAADRPQGGGAMLRICSTAEAEPAEIDTSKPITKNPLKWSNYPRGVVAGFAERGHQSWRFGRSTAFHRPVWQRFVQQRRVGSLHRDFD